MLKQRLLTAIILIPLFIFLVLKLPPIGFFVLTAIFVLLGAFEWSAFIGLNRFPAKIIYPIFIVLMLVGAFFLPVTYVMLSGLVFWLLALVLVILYPKLSTFWGKSVILRSLMGVLVLIPCLVALNYIRNLDSGPYVLLYLCVLIWGADSGAYFVGRLWGKHPLAPSVSPGKSIQGLVGGLVTTIAITFLALNLFKTPYSMWSGVLLLSFMTVLFSVLGDLFESMLKRNAGLKDSGTILPGHGGILDRIDSLTAAAPAFAMGSIWLSAYYQ